jgi:hypothetical protein
LASLLQGDLVRHVQRPDVLQLRRGELPHHHYCDRLRGQVRRGSFRRPH